MSKKITNSSEHSDEEKLEYLFAERERFQELFKLNQQQHDIHRTKFEAIIGQQQNQLKALTLINEAVDLLKGVVEKIYKRLPHLGSGGRLK